MPINIRDFSDQSVPVGSSSVAGVEHQTSHLRWGAAGTANEVLTTSPLPVELRARDAAVVAQALTAIAAGTKIGLASIILDSAGNIISSFGGAPAAVLSHVDVSTGAVYAQRLKSGAGKLRSIHVVPGDTEVGPIFATFHNSNNTPPVAADAVVAKYGFGGGFPNDYVIPGGGIAVTAGLGIRLVKNVALNDNTAPATGALIMVTYE